MSTETTDIPLTGTLQVGVVSGKRRTLSQAEERGKWWRLMAVLIITALVLAPIVAVFVLSLQPSLGSTANGWTLENFSLVFSQTSVGIWLQNSLVVTLITVLVAVAVAAPAGYVLSRGRSKMVSGYSLILFIVQSLPVVTAVIPLFILFAQVGLVDNLAGVTIIYVGSTMSVAVIMMLPPIIIFAVLNKYFSVGGIGGSLAGK
jgi:multiple sugar transport system permease protein